MFQNASKSGSSSFPLALYTVSVYFFAEFQIVGPDWTIVGVGIDDRASLWIRCRTEGSTEFTLTVTGGIVKRLAGHAALVFASYAHVLTQGCTGIFSNIVKVCCYDVWPVLH